MTEEDYNIIDLIKGKKSIAIFNKTDLPNSYTMEDLRKLLGHIEIIEASIANGIGIDKLEEKIKEMFYSGSLELDSTVVVTNIRHKNQLEKALRNMESALEDIRANIPLDCIEVDLRIVGII